MAKDNNQDSFSVGTSGVSATGTPAASVTVPTAAGVIAYCVSSNNNNSSSNATNSDDTDMNGDNDTQISGESGDSGGCELF